MLNLDPELVAASEGYIAGEWGRVWAQKTSGAAPDREPRRFIIICSLTVYSPSHPR